MNRLLNFDELRLAMHNKSKKIVIAFAYDFDSQETICGNMVLSKNKFQLQKLPIIDLTFYNLKDTCDFLTDEKDITGDLRGGFGYLTQVGINKENWKECWGIFDWASLDNDGTVKVCRKKTSVNPPP